MDQTFDTRDWVILIAALIATVFIWHRKFHVSKRTKAARRFADEHGWSFNKSLSSLTSRWRSAPFDQGTKRGATNVLSRTDEGRQVLSFEYEFSSVGNGEYRKTWFYHVVAVSLPAPLPWLQLTRDGSGAAVAKLFGGQDIDFESSAFNDAWRVRSVPGQYAHDFVHPRMMHRLLAPDAARPSITVEGGDIYLYVPGPQDLEAVEGYVRLLTDVVDLVPRHLWLKVGHDPLAVDRTSPS